MRAPAFYLLTIAVFVATGEARGLEKIRTCYYDGDLESIAVSLDGQRYAVATTRLDSILVYQRDEGKLIARIPRERRCVGHCGLAFSPDGKTVAYSLLAQDAEKIPYFAVRVVSPGEATASIELKDPDLVIHQLAFGTGELLAAVQSDDKVLVWNLRTKSLVFQSDKQSAPKLTFTPDGNTLVSVGSVGRERSLLRWHIKDKKPRVHVGTIRPSPLAACCTRDGKQVLIGNSAGEIEVWPIAGDRPDRVISLLEVENELLLSQMAISPDGRRVAAVYNKAIFISDIHTGKTICRMSHSKGYDIVQLAFSGDGEFLFSGAEGLRPDVRSETILWKVESRKSKE
jgi:WD40 repeat protein